MSSERWSVSAEDAWRLLTEPMDHEEAEAAADAVALAVPHVHAMPVDPKLHLLLAWGRWSVEMFVEALDSLHRDGRPVPQGRVNEMRRWLDRADDYQDGDDRWPKI